MTDHDKLAEEVLDRALRDYGSAEPLAGLEDRVLAVVRGRKRRPGWPFLPGLLRPAFAGLAVVFVAALLLWARRAGEGPAARGLPRPVAVAQATPREHPVPVLAGADRATPVLARRAAGRPAAAGFPRRPVFPSPSDLGEQERLLLLYVSTTPPDELEASGGFLDAPARLPALPDASTTP